MKGACSGVLSTTQFPAASAGATFMPTDTIGPFHVKMTPDHAVRLEQREVEAAC